MIFNSNNIRKLKNSKLNEKCFIIANGPSVKKEDLNKLSGQDIISINASPLLEEEYNFKSNYHVVSDLRFFEVEFKREIAKKKEIDPQTVCVYRSEFKNLDVTGKNNYFVDAIGRDGFSTDLSHGYYFGCSTTVLAIQLAYYLGFSEIYLLGVDLIYPKDSPRFYEEKSPSPIDNNNSIQINSIRCSYNILKDKGVELFICSEVSLLRPYIPFMSFENAIRKKRKVCKVG